MVHSQNGKGSNVRSMTGFASGRGAFDVFQWVWDIRAVNGRGLDIRLRVPDWIDGLEADLRRAIQGAATRGNVSLTLRITREQESDVPTLNPVGLSNALSVISEIEYAAAAANIRCAPLTAADIAAMRGVMDVGDTPTEDTTLLKKAILAELPALLADFNAAREGEGRALAGVLRDQLQQIETLTADARIAADARLDDVRAAMERALQRVMDAADTLDPARVTQELALIAVKADITEEIDRLGAHITAGRTLLDADQAIGRKLDFLTQEFNREANTLCSKAQSPALTAIGLDLKAVIDQMREQVQNIE